MLVGKISKESGDRSRVVIDFIDWLDPGEALVEPLSDPFIGPDSGAWANSEPPENLPPDDAPLVMFSLTAADAATKAIFLLSDGTPGYTYLVNFEAIGSISQRIQKVQFRVACVEVPG
jgi:hypothetical protein